jgi:hypothetical protein
LVDSVIGAALDRRDRIAHHAVDLLLGPEAEQEGAGCGGGGDVGERQHADVGGGRDRADRADRLIEQRAEDHPGAFGDHLLGRLAGALGRALGVARQERQIVGADIEQRHLGGIEHVLREPGRGAGQRQQQADPQLGEGLLELARRWLRRQGRLRYPFGGAGRQQEQQTDT